ncbi:hypothetical protein GGR53DRAFT_519954 [Hypoxylon sp. FL1150]|nr:hypothetical protein GGR53DRAFT_519954 [Hypoxylon sp. FL1150]
MTYYSFLLSDEIIPPPSESQKDKILAELKGLAPGRVDTIVLSGSVETDVANIAKYGSVDVFQDFPPSMVTNKSHIMAGILSDLEIPYSALVYGGLRVQGTLMYTRGQTLDFIKLIETGTNKLGPEAGLNTNGVFKIEEWEAAFELAAKQAGVGKTVYFTPNPYLL